MAHPRIEYPSKASRQHEIARVFLNAIGRVPGFGEVFPPSTTVRSTLWIGIDETRPETWPIAAAELRGQMIASGLEHCVSRDLRTLENTGVKAFQYSHESAVMTVMRQYAFDSERYDTSVTVWLA